MKCTFPGPQRLQTLLLHLFVYLLRDFQWSWSEGRTEHSGNRNSKCSPTWTRSTRHTGRGRRSWTSGGSPRSSSADCNRTLPPCSWRRTAACPSRRRWRWQSLAQSRGCRVRPSCDQWYRSAGLTSARIWPAWTPATTTHSIMRYGTNNSQNNEKFHI